MIKPKVNITLLQIKDKEIKINMTANMTEL